MSTLNNKVALVTGAARGIGAVVARKLADAGSKVIINYASGKDIAEALVADIKRQFEVNVRGTFNTMREAATRLADHGSIINFSTTNLRVIVPSYSIYAATKAAVEQFTRIFSKEIGGRGINVNAIAPGPVNTELFTKGKSPELIARFAAMTAFNRIGEPEDIAGVVLFLAGDDAKWINGQSIGVNGAMA